jgi:hypothetical protein
MSPSIFGRIKSTVTRSGVGREIARDFIAISNIDPELGVVVLSDHIVAVIETSGTDYRYATSSQADNIIAGWREFLSTSPMSVQILVHRRPIVWNLANGYLDTMERQVKSAAAIANATNRPEDASWMQRRLDKHKKAIESGELDRQTPDDIGIADLRQYFVIRRAIGKAEADFQEGQPTVYIPHPRGLRTLVTSLRTTFGTGDVAIRAWHRMKVQAAVQLDDEVSTFISHIHRVPDLEVRRLMGAELIQVYQMLLRDREATAEWIDDDAALREWLVGATSEGGPIVRNPIDFGDD